MNLKCKIFYKLTQVLFTSHFFAEVFSSLKYYNTSLIPQHAVFGMIYLKALYSNFKNDFGDLLEVTDFSVLTWLALGAGLQLLSQAWLSSGLSYWLPLIYLIYRTARVSFDCCRIFNGTFTNIKFGRWSATLPESTDSSMTTATSDGGVMFLLGARINQLVFFFCFFIDVSGSS